MKTRVFISYAWENQALKNAVWKLAGFLNYRGSGQLEIILDQLFTNRPPSEGWLVWMQQQIRMADVVLIVCTPLYLERFLKEEDDLSKGLGVTFEGAIITQGFYNAKGINTKFYPIIPDGGSVNNVPDIFQAYFNHQAFPTANEAIYKLVIGDNPTLEYYVEIGEEESKLEIVTETDIVDEIVDDKMSNENIGNPVQILVRAFLSLNETQKLEVINKVAIPNSDLSDSQDFYRDKKFFLKVKELGLFNPLWETINAIKPFENTINPF